MKRFKPERYIPTDSAEQSFPAAGIVAYIYPIRRGRHGLMVYKGRQSRAALHYSYDNEEALAWALHGYATAQAHREAAKTTARRERATVAHGLSVGDVVSRSWGYEQTNVNFFQVVRVVSPRTVEVRAIAAAQARAPDPCGMAGYVIPAPNAFLQQSTPFRCLASHPGVVAGKGWRLYRWDGRALLVTSYH
jgi:hypothetical protein